MNTCKIPVPVDDSEGDHRWMSIVYYLPPFLSSPVLNFKCLKHNRFLSEIREKDADVIFIGDSIVQALQHTEIWNELFAPLHCLNFGIHRDKIENVLWRVQNGELDYVKPKVIILHVGTNNHFNSSEEITEGITEIIMVIREKHPDAYIVVPVSFLLFFQD